MYCRGLYTDQFLLKSKVVTFLFTQGDPGHRGFSGQQGPPGFLGDRGERGVKGNKGYIGPLVSDFAEKIMFLLGRPFVCLTITHC